MSARFSAARTQPRPSFRPAPRCGDPMSSLTKSLHPDEKYKADKIGSRLFSAGLGVGVLLLVLSIIMGATIDDPPGTSDIGGGHWRHFFYAYLTAWSYIWSIAIGMLFFVM